MSGGSAAVPRANFIQSVGRHTLAAVSTVGNVSLFGLSMLRWLVSHGTRRSILLPNMYQIGVQSVPVVAITGGFIGMVLAVQSYNQFRMMHLETRMGAVINMSLVTELGPVLAATMLAGRIGSAMAAELGTMRVTEQIDALRALGANPLHYLVVPRFLASVLLIPMLTVIADAVGMFGGWFISTQVMGVDSFHYWHHTDTFLTGWDVCNGLVKSIAFGAAISLIACHRGFHCGAGAEGVGRAATEAFVFSFIAILAIDFVLGVLMNNLYYLIWPQAVSLM